MVLARRHWHRVDGGIEAVEVGTQLVRIHRRLDDWDPLEGYLMARTEAWSLLARLSPEIFLVGFVAFQTRHVSKVETSEAIGTFVRAALTMRGGWPPAPPEIDLDLTGTAELLRSAAAYPLVTVYKERSDPDVCYSGVPQKIGDTSFAFREVTPGATWSRRARAYRFSRITRVEVGGWYEDALHAVAGPPPSRRRPGRR